MSIHVEIINRCAEGRLSILLPILRNSPVRRKIYLSPEIWSLLEGPWADNSQERLANRLRADLEVFIEGRTIAVRQKPSGKNDTAYMVRLYPSYQEVWEIRSRDPKPGIRVFGCFAATDLFIALTWADRIQLGDWNSPEWNAAINLCKSEWRKLFYPYSPISGSDFNVYISTGLILV